MKETVINKNRNYPLLDNQQLLSLIRANQILLTDLEERLIFLEEQIKNTGGINEI